MNTLRYAGLDLPIYGSETKVLFEKEGFVQAARAHDRFVRDVDIGQTSPYDSLARHLQATDDEFERFAEITGIGVIDYRWGLYQDPHARSHNGLGVAQHRIPPNFVPEDYILVADVQSVKKARSLRFMSSFAVKDGIRDYKGNRAGKTRLGDLYPGQCARGRHQGIKGKWLVDIEPRLI